eukprot:COSAG03_NODE_296_length_9245_cov_95.789744_4_plen_44_part_00
MGGGGPEFSTDDTDTQYSDSVLKWRRSVIESESKIFSHLAVSD